jgi:hypothetical protein
VNDAERLGANQYRAPSCIELNDVEIPVKEITRRLQRSESLVRGVLRDTDGVERKSEPEGTEFSPTVNSDTSSTSLVTSI